MDLGRFFRREALSASWRHQAQGLLWRIVPDHAGGLIGEERDPAAKTVTFFRVIVESGEVVWRDVTVPGGWWTGIECATGRVLLLHGFASPDLPGHRGLTALDLRTGAALWHDDDVVFVAATDGVAYGVRGRPEQPELVGRDLATGTVRTAGPADEASMRGLVMRWQAEEPPPVSLPEPVDAGTEGGAAARALLAGVPIAEGWLEVLRSGGAVVTAHHELTTRARGDRPEFRRVLSVFSGETAALAYRETLDENLPAPVPESFFVVDRTLLFVKERRTLCAVHLAGRRDEA